MRRLATTASLPISLTPALAAQRAARAAPFPSYLHLSNYFGNLWMYPERLVGALRSGLEVRAGGLRPFCSP